VWELPDICGSNILKPEGTNFGLFLAQNNDKIMVKEQGLFL
jgi:hypothetical protein